MQLYNVYVSQNGSNLRAVLDERSAHELQQAVHRKGIPVGIWISRGRKKEESIGITLNPRRGGVVLSMRPARPVPADEHGNPLDPESLLDLHAQGKAPQWLPPEQQDRGQLIYPDWSGDEIELSNVTLEAMASLQDSLDDEAQDAERLSGLTLDDLNDDEDGDEDDELDNFGDLDDAEPPPAIEGMPRQAIPHSPPPNNPQRT